LLRLAVCRRGRRTVIRDAYATGAFKLSRPIDPDGSGQVLLFLMNPGGGYVDGDRYRLKLELEPGAEMTLTTQSATKVYKTPSSGVRSDTEAELAEGAWLEIVPDPVIAYSGSRYFQRTILKLQPGAAVFCSDAWTPGWSRDGALFPYNRIDSLTELYIGGQLQMRDRLAVVPARYGGDRDLFEGYTHYGSVLAVHEKAQEPELSRLHDYLQACCASRDIRFGVTRLIVPGAVLRILARSTEELQLAAEACRDYVRREWLGKAPLRLRK